MFVEDNLSEYVEIMKERARGSLPEMGSAKRTVEILIEKDLLSRDNNSIIDIGAATCHYYRSFLNKNINLDLYAGVEIDRAMSEAAESVWAKQISDGKLIINNNDVENFELDKIFDIAICANAFMYFKSPYMALKNIFKHTSKYVLIRGYFADQSYRILRSQTSSNHDKVKINEADSFAKDGTLKSYDYWSIYSREYIESVVKDLNPCASIEWIEDKNKFESINEEKELNISKRGGTYVIENMEISYPFIQPWEYILVSFV